MKITLYELRIKNSYGNIGSSLGSFVTPETALLFFNRMMYPHKDIAGNKDLTPIITPVTKEVGEI